MGLKRAVYSFGIIWILFQPPLNYTLSAEVASGSRPVAQSIQFVPLVTYDFSSRLHLLLVLAALSTETKPIEAEEAEILWNKTQQTIKSLNDPASSEINKSLTLAAARLLHYYLSHDGEDRIATAQKWLATYAAAGSETSKKPALKAKFSYFQKVAEFYQSKRPELINEIVALRPQLQSEKILAANIDLLSAYSLSLSPANAGPAAGFLSQAAPSLGVYGKIVQKLIAASIDVGIDGEGNLSGSIKPSYDAKLAHVAVLAKSLPSAAQSQVLATVIFIWNKAQGGKDAKAPIYLSEGFKSQRPIESLREREALNLIKAQNYKAAGLIYRRIAENLVNLSLDVDKRLWEIDVLIYQKTVVIGDLEKSYVKMREKYLAEAKSKESGAFALWQAVSETYRSILDQVVNQANQPQASAALKTTAVQALVSYSKIENEASVVYPYKVKLAQLYRSLNLYREATDLFLELAGRDNSIKLFLAAIEAQSQLAKWPQQPPFEGVTGGPEIERQKLLAIYEKLAKVKNAEDWFILAHTGLLLRSLQQEKAAEDLWRTALPKAQAGKFALEAGGLLLSDFYAAKRWQDVIDLAHQFSSRKFAVTQKYKPIAYGPWLGDALLNGGTLDLQSKAYARSVKNLEEFIENYPNDPREPQAVHSLALSYVGLSKYTPALNTVRIIADKHPAYPARPKLLLQAAEWAQLDRSNIEFAIFFYTKYISDYKNEANIPQIRVLLAETYLKRKLYGWASRIYSEQSLSAKVSKDLQLQAAVKVMEIEEKYGELKDASTGATRVLQLASPQDPAAIHALAFLGRYTAQNKDLKGMNEIEPKLLPHVNQSKEVLEAIGQLRFRRAELTTQIIMNNETNVQIRDPEATVKKYAERFEVEKQPYLKVCQVGINTMCAPALWRLTTVARQALDAIEKIEIAETLGPSRVNSFNVFKQLYLNKILTAHKDFKDQALKLVNQGTTTAGWREEITKAVDLDLDATTTH